jgi:hypothetical protein
MMSRPHADDSSTRPPRRESPPQAPHHRPPGHAGRASHGRRASAEDYLSAWGPGGWSREHGLEHHGAPGGKYARGQYDRGYRAGDRPQYSGGWWGQDDGAPTG